VHTEEPAVAAYVPIAQISHAKEEVVGEENEADKEVEEALPTGHKEHTLSEVAVQADL